MFNLEMNSENEVYIYKCEEIIEYSDDSILLCFDNCNVRISGSALSMVSYSNGEMYIEGDILRIEFESSGKSKANESGNVAKDAA